MKAFFVVPVLASAVFVCGQSWASVPGNPRTIAGIDCISPRVLGHVLSNFCKSNECSSTLVWDKDAGYGWNLYTTDGHRPVGAGSGCADIPHRYCVQTWGTKGDSFMSKDRVTVLKKLLESKGAKVTLMNCLLSIGVNLCADGKPPP